MITKLDNRVRLCLKTNKKKIRKKKIHTIIFQLYKVQEQRNSINIGGKQKIMVSGSGEWSMKLTEKEHEEAVWDAEDGVQLHLGSG